ncbi:hypothetical protein [Vagococcus fluvialis]|uniref:hypothetical protein n=1 Tax=Vagococcus fluvialis TaxID=2738 RepID=UPI001D0A69A4|nr:hypothetical protein [Vagococcus fluvialis]UDM72778.1 hypothetical protein K5L00_14585 [Vagococcus fluvialis]UDM78334.1 hypothetical protein K5K98_14790 [Vagococcus fluvialis]UDM84053.1 hypothetical protein K5K96_14610 [Vagococcus fluvialis]
MQTVKEFLSEKELNVVKEDHEKMFYDSFMYDGLVSERVLESIKNVYGEVGLELVAKNFARREFESTTNMSVNEYIEYYGENDTLVKDKQLKAAQEMYANIANFVKSFKKPVIVGTVWVRTESSREEDISFLVDYWGFERELMEAMSDKEVYVGAELLKMEDVGSLNLKVELDGEGMIWENMKDEVAFRRYPLSKVALSDDLYYKTK